jgi:serine-type D-Ala-D-Ala carboxypeptidase/endopeptidase
MLKAIATIAIGLWLMTATITQAASPPTDWTVPTDPEIRQLLVDRIDVQHRGVGVVVGVIDAHGRRIISHGALETGDPRPIGGDTIFEIGSMSKVFTSLLLADMVRRGEVRLDDPVVKYLPPGVVMPTRAGKQITLIDLATHTSGLPRLPGNMAMKDPSNPYADYTVEQLYAFLKTYQLPRDIGAKYEYSNLGGGLLGHVLARRAGMDYGALVRQRITKPLKMADTTIALSPAQMARLAKGHAADLGTVANWDLPTLAGAGALRSDANDILTFLAAELGYTPTPLVPAMADQIVPRRPTDLPVTEVALAWHIHKTPAREIVWHNGGTGGYRTFMGFDAKARVGVVVMTNVANGPGADDIGFHLLTGSPLSVPPKDHHAIVVAPQALQPYAGRYQFAPNVFLTVTLADGQLSAQLTGQGAAAIFPESPTDFFYKIVDAQISFETGPDGRATGLILHQNGRNTPAKRISDGAP